MQIVIADLNDKSDGVLTALEKTLIDLERRLAMGPPPPADVIRAQIARVLANMSRLRRAASRLSAAEVEMLSIDTGDFVPLQASFEAIERVSTYVDFDVFPNAAESLLEMIEIFVSRMEQIASARSFP